MSVHMLIWEEAVLRRYNKETISNIEYIFSQILLTIVISVAINDADSDIISERYSKIIS